jgi:hypothetical protein
MIVCAGLMSLPPALAVGALYDSLLQSALRQFFERAVLDAEPTPSLSSDGRLAIEPSSDPRELTIRWFGTRYRLRVPGQSGFTAHEVRLAKAIGTVLSARYRAILNPRVMAERGDLFRGAIEDRYVGAFFDDQLYAMEGRDARADRIASVIELLRVAALSSYENGAISTGVLLLGTENDPCRLTKVPHDTAPFYTELLTTTKSFYRLADGVRTVFLANADGRLLDIIDIERWSSEVASDAAMDTPCAKAFQAHARATERLGHVCAVLSPSREIKIFAEGAEVFTFRGASWHLLDLKAKYQLWEKAVGNQHLALRLFQTGLDLAESREGALFVVAREPDIAVPQLVASADRLDSHAVPRPESTGTAPSRRELLHLLAGRSVTDLDPTVLGALASIDGATVTDRSGRLLAAGAILRHPPSDEVEERGIVEGARTTAAIAASRFGPVLKVSEDGIMTFFDRQRVWDI